MRIPYGGLPVTRSVVPLRRGEGVRGCGSALGQRGPEDVPAQPLKTRQVTGREREVGVPVVPVEARAPLRDRVLLAARHPHPPHLLSSAEAESDLVREGGELQQPVGVLPVAARVRMGVLGCAGGSLPREPAPTPQAEALALGLDVLGLRRDLEEA